MRLEVMQRDGFKCVHCEETKEMLNVHHSYYVAGRDPWDYPASTMITLCHKCHKGFTERQEGFRVEDGCTLGSWETEASFLMQTIIKTGFHCADSMVLYSALMNSKAVAAGEVNPAYACEVLGKAIEFLMDDEWLDSLAEEAFAARKQGILGGKKGGGQ